MAIWIVERVCPCLDTIDVEVHHVGDGAHR